MVSCSCVSISFAFFFSFLFSPFFFCLNVEQICVHTTSSFATFSLVTNFAFSSHSVSQIFNIKNAHPGNDKAVQSQLMPENDFSCFTLSKSAM